MINGIVAFGHSLAACVNISAVRDGRLGMMRFILSGAHQNNNAYYAHWLDVRCGLLSAVIFRAGLCHPTRIWLL